MKKQTVLIIVILTILSLVLAACGAQPAATPPAVDIISTNEVVAEGRLEPVHATTLSFQVRGVVEDVLVSAGDAVKEGDVLARLANAGGAEAQVLIAQNAYDLLLRTESGDRAKLQQAYMDAQIARVAAETKWEDLDVDTIEDNIEDDKATVEDLQQDLKDVQEEFDKYRDLDKDNTKRQTAEDNLETAREDLNQALRDLDATMRERDEVQAAYDSALAVEAEAKHQYGISLDGPNADQLTLARANLNAAQDALSSYVLTAPFDGTVAEVSVKVGEQVGTDTRALSLADFSEWLIETTDVNELEVVKLAVGQPVAFAADALPAVTMYGEVTEISQSSTLQGGDVIYAVRIRVNPDVDSRLKWGMTVEVTFQEVQK